MGCFPTLIVTLFFVGGTVGLLLSLRWLYTFVMTDYRSHLAPFAIPFALFTLLASLLSLWFAKFMVWPGDHGKSSSARDRYGR